MSELVIKNLHVSIEGKEILKGVNLMVRQGETHAIMGPNGTGKSTLAYTLMGHPSYTVTAGEVLFHGLNLLNLPADERSSARTHQLPVNCEPGSRKVLTTWSVPAAVNPSVRPAKHCCDQ